MNIFTIITIASLAIFAGFVGIGIRKFGLLPSYSHYSIEWDKAVPMYNMHLWSIVTFVVALLLVVPMVQRGIESGWQFLGFFAPAYLIIVAAFPLTEEKPDESEEEKKQHKKRYMIHSIAAIVCAIAAVLWLIFVCHGIKYILAMLLVTFFAAYASNTIKKSYVFWLEMAAFGAVYAALLN